MPSSQQRYGPKAEPEAQPSGWIAARRIEYPSNIGG
jgi:hypothetical protein